MKFKRSLHFDPEWCLSYVLSGSSRDQEVYADLGKATPAQTTRWTTRWATYTGGNVTKQTELCET